MKDQSHKDEMSAAIRGDFERLRERGVSTTLAPPSESEPEPESELESEPELEPEPELELELEPELELESELEPESSAADVAPEQEHEEIDLDVSLEGVPDGVVEPVRRGRLARLLGR